MKSSWHSINKMIWVDFAQLGAMQGQVVLRSRYSGFRHNGTACDKAEEDVGCAISQSNLIRVVAAELGQEG